MAVDSDGTLVIVENNLIRRINGSTYVQTFGGIGAATNQFGASGVTGLEIDASGNVWCADPGKNRIAVFDKWGNYLMAISDGTAQFKIGDFDIAADGRIYAVNTVRSTIEVYTAQGVYVTSMGQTGKPGEPQLSAPQSVVVDSAGRVLGLTPQGIFVYVPRDLTAPVSTLTLNPTYALNDWVNRSVTATINATDGFIGLGVSEIKYKINGGSTVVPGNVASFTQAAEGLYTVEYSATDIALNTETTKTFQFGIDYTPPVTSYLFSDGKRFLGLVASDALSGDVGTAYILDTDNAQTYVDPIYLDGGNHTIKYLSSDAAGNYETMRTLDVSGSRVTSLYVEPGTTVSEGPASFRAVLDKPAPGGAEVYIYFPDLDIDDFIEIEPGKSEGTLIYDNVIPVTRAVNLKVWAFLGGDSFVESTLRVVPKIMTLSVGPRELMPGGKATGKVTIQYKSDNSPLQISSSNPNVVVPSSVKWAGKNTAGFQVKVLPNTPPGTATITVKYNEQILSTDVTIGAYELVDAYIDPNEVGYGGVAAVYAVINAPAPPNGLVLNLTGYGPLGKVPVNLTVPGGETVGAASFVAGTYSGEV